MTGLLEEGNPQGVVPLEFSPAFYRIPLTPPFPAFAGDRLWRGFEGKSEKRGFQIFPLRGGRLPGGQKHFTTLTPIGRTWERG